MGTDLTPLGPDEVVAVPVGGDDDLVLVLGRGLKDGGSPVPWALVDAVVDKGGLLGGAVAARGLLDGSLVRLAPETVKQLRQGATLVKYSQGFALGTLKRAGGARFSHSVRFVPGPAISGRHLHPRVLADAGSCSTNLCEGRDNRTHGRTGRGWKRKKA